MVGAGWKEIPGFNELSTEQGGWASQPVQRPLGARRGVSKSNLDALWDMGC